jgi:DNA-binding response OmpR family regulator
MVKTKILIVDDEPDFLKVVKLNLEDTGKFQVLTLPNANEIISSLHSFKPQLIILDMVMPGIGGMEICDILNKDSLGKTLPILILSALDKDKDKLAAYKKGIVGYLTKPIEKDTLIAKIENVLHPRPER